MNHLKKWSVGILFLSSVAFPNPASAQTCGGTERWAVKVGTDSGVGGVQLSTPIPMTVPDMLGLNEPQRPPTGDNDTRLAEETHVYVVTGHLKMFKVEAGSKGDQDFHMVVTDDTLQYTDDKHHMPPGHSLVAEIPNPDCIAGQQGDPSVHSRFIDAIRSARGKLETQFTSIDVSGKFNDAGGIPVRITGIGFFDFPHHQIGRATNNLELHPVLDITFNPAPEDFSLSASPGTLSIGAGGTANVTVSSATAGGLSSAVALSVDGTPPNTAVTFSSTSIPAPGSSTMAVSTSALTPPGNYSLTVKGLAAGQTHSVPVTIAVTVADTVLPVTSVTAPIDGSTGSGLVNITATGSDNVGVVKLEIYIDGAIRACNVGAVSISFPWDTSVVANGIHTIISKAYDAAGNVGTSQTIAVTVSN